MKCAMFVVSSAACLLASAGSALAGTYSATLTNQNIFGSVYNVNIFRVATDLSSQGLTPAAGRLEPEGMVFSNGTLYVSGDGSTAEANGYLAAYPGGNIAGLPGATRFTVTVGSNTAAFGPEGITVNTRGSGYGSFAGPTPRIIGADNVVSPVSARVTGVMNVSTASVEDIQAVPFAVNSDDVAFVPGATAADDRLAFIDGATTPPSIIWYTAAAVPAPTGTGGFALTAQAKGLLYLPAADAALFDPAATTDCLLVSAGPDFVGDTNKLLLYTLGGTLLNTANLPAGTGAGLLGGIEALAFDPVTKNLFIGDENGASSQIAVLTIPAPGAVALLGLGGLVAVRRRR